MAYTLLWDLGILSSRKDVQEKVYEAALEDKKVGGDDEEMKWVRDNYLLAFVKELGRWSTTFRLAFAHETMGQNVWWKGHCIPVGTLVYTNIHAMNRGTCIRACGGIVLSFVSTVSYSP